jgi:hypothetical protein
VWTNLKGTPNENIGAHDRLASSLRDRIHACFCKLVQRPRPQHNVELSAPSGTQRPRSFGYAKQLAQQGQRGMSKPAISSFTTQQGDQSLIYYGWFSTERHGSSTPARRVFSCPPEGPWATRFPICPENITADGTKEPENGCLQSLLGCVYRKEKTKCRGEAVGKEDNIRRQSKFCSPSLGFLS